MIILKVTKNQFHSSLQDDSNKLVIGEINPEIGGVGITEFVGLKPNIYSFLVDNNSEHKKAKVVNRNVVATISHTDYKNVMLSNKC